MLALASTTSLACAQSPKPLTDAQSKECYATSIPRQISSIQHYDGA